MKVKETTHFTGRDCNFKDKLYELFTEFEDKEVLVTPEFIKQLKTEAKKQKEEESLKQKIATMPEVELTLESFEMEPLPEGFEVFDEEDD